ncbi:hypothetical protein [Candidatus Methylobacter oryzae]|nr:hypothetical protein [Candidatus Methylobacter oryzae]
MKKQKTSNNNRTLKILFVAWFLYSAGILGWTALNDTTRPHCLILENNGG